MEVNLSNVKVRVRGTMVEVDPETHSPMYDTYLLDASLKLESGILTVEGKRVEYEIVFGGCFIDSSNCDKYAESDYEYGYKGIFDYFKGKKTPCVDGWVRLKQTTPYKAMLSEFKLTGKGI